MKTIQEVAWWCMDNAIGFTLEYKDGEADFLTVIGEHKFKTASYHSETGELVLMSSYPECIDIDPESLNS